MKKNIKSFVKIAVAVALVTWLFWELDWSLVAEELQSLQVGYLVLFVGFQILAMLCSTKKWVSIAEHQDIHFGVWEGLKAYLTGTFINNFFPSTIGGDIYRSLWLSKKGNEKGTAFSVVIFDRVTGLFMTLVLAFITGFIVWWYLGNLPHFLMLSYLGVFAALVTFMAIAFFAPESALARINWSKARSFFETALSYRNVQVWTEASFWSALFIVLGLGVSNYILFLALGYTLPFLPFLGLACLMALYVSLPLSINNIGIKEWAYGVLFVLLGVSFEVAITVALLSRLLQTGISLAALPVYLLEKRATLLPLPVHSDTLSQSVKDVR